MVYLIKNRELCVNRISKSQLPDVNLTPLQLEKICGIAYCEIVVLSHTENISLPLERDPFRKSRQETCSVMIYRFDVV